MWNAVRSIQFLCTAATLVSTAAAAPPTIRLPHSVGQDAVAVATIDAFPDAATSVAFSPDGRTLAAGSYMQLVLWDVAQKQTVLTRSLDAGFARSLAFSPDGKLLAVGGYQKLWLFGVAERDLIQTLSGHRGYINDLCFSPDGSLLASASEDLTAGLWDVAGRTESRRLTGHTHPLLGIAFSPDGTRLATAAGDETRLTRPGEVKTWNVAEGTVLQTLPPPERGATDVAFSPDGAWLVSTSFDEKVNVYNAATGEAVGFFGGHSRPTTCVVFAGNDVVISGSGGRFKGKNEIKIWKREDGEELGTIDAHEGKINGLSLAPNGTMLAAASHDNTVSVWDIAPILAKLIPSPDAAPSTAAAAAAVAPADTLAADAPTANASPDAEKKLMRIGIIGLDTSHAVAFTQALNGDSPPAGCAGCRIVAAYPQGSPDIESSVSRVPGYIAEVKQIGVEIVDSIDALLERVDAVCLETNDGRPHFDQVLPALRAKKPVFIDKPIAASLSDAIAIYAAAGHYDTPVFSSSSLRWIEGAQAVRGGSIGRVLGADCYSPCSLEATHPDLFWYGVHGVEMLFTVMGTGCESVSRSSTENFDVAVGTWSDGRIGTFRGMRAGKRGYGGTVFGENEVQTLGKFNRYEPLVAAMIEFFRTGKPPVESAESLEIYAFMAAADESKRQGGAPVTLESVMTAARAAAKERLAGKLDQVRE